MIKKIILSVLFAPLLALAQSYPSPTFNNLTVNGTFTAAGKVGLASLASQAANTVVANVTGSSASPTAFAMPGCSATGNVIQYTSGTGFTCATGYALLASPTFTGTPAAPTASATTNTTQVATTAMVNSAITSGSLAGSFTTLSASSTLTGFPGRLINVQVFTSSGTYTPTTGAHSAIVFGSGGGGGGGGAATTTNLQGALGGAGSSGSFGAAYVTSLSSQTVTIGAAGSGGSAGANAGGAGGQTSIGTWLVCPGGLGGNAGTATAFASVTLVTQPANAGAICTSSVTALYLTPGYVGTYAILEYNDSGAQVGSGGSGPYGSGGLFVGIGAGGTATGNGAGGSGSFLNPSQSAAAGGNGTKGIVIVWEFS